MAGIACAHQLGTSLLTLSERAKSFNQTPGRCSLHHSENGPVFICDTEKSPYLTLPLALDVLKIFKNAPRRTLIIGTVSDKGGTSRKRYDAVTKNDEDFIDRIIFFGELASHARPSESQLASGNVFFYTKIEDLRDFIKSTLIHNEVILLKGSSKVDKMERIAIDYDSTVSCWIDNCTLAENCFSCELAHK
jgi:UDP-N-acetylmuramoyl-tripeptide--D-alanyl-D-alanine ligase